MYVYYKNIIYIRVCLFISITLGIPSIPGYTYNKTCPSVCDILIMNNMKQEYL